MTTKVKNSKEKEKTDQAPKKPRPPRASGYVDKADSDFGLDDNHMLSLNTCVLEEHTDPATISDIAQRAVVMADVENTLLNMILAMRQESYQLDDEEHDGEAEMEALLDAYKVASEKRSEVREQAKRFADYLMGEVKVESSNGKETVANPRGSRGFLYLEKTSGIESKMFPLLRRYGFFPLDWKGLCKQELFGVVDQVASKLRSFYQIDQGRKLEQAKWITKREEFLVKQPNSQKVLELSQELLSRIVLDVSGSTKATKNCAAYKNFLRNFTGRNHKGRRVKLHAGSSMRKFFLERLDTHPDKRFKKSDQSLYGYAADFMNFLYFDCRELWLEKDLIGEGAVKSLIIGSFYFGKKHVNISSFKSEHLSVMLGDNFINYTLKKQHGRFVIETHGNNSPIWKIVAACPRSLFGDAELTESYDEAGVYRLRYASDSKNKTYYLGYIKQPIIRFHAKSKGLVVSFPVGQVEDENAASRKGRLSKSEIRKIKYLFASSPVGAKVPKRLGKLKRTIRVMVVDLNFFPSMMCSVCEINQYSCGQFRFGRWVKQGIPTPSSPNAKKEAQAYMRMTDINNTLSDLIEATEAYVRDGKEIPTAFGDEEVGFRSWTKLLKIDRKEYIANIDSLPFDPESEEPLVYQWKSNGHDWMLFKLLHKVKKSVRKVRHRYHLADDKVDYTQNHNKADVSQLRLMEMYMSYVRLQKRLNPSNKDAASSYWKSINGLRRFYTKTVASYGASIALEYDCTIAAFEDLDCKNSLFDTAEENRMRSLWALGLLKKAIKDKFSKHGIGVVTADANYTSVTDPETGELGVRDEDDPSKVWLERDGKAVPHNSHVLSNMNVANKITTQHSNVPNFYAKVLEGGAALLSCPQDKYKRKARTLERHFGGTALVIREKTKSQKGELEVVVKDLSDEELKVLSDNVDSKEPGLSLWRVGSKLYRRDKYEAFRKERLQTIERVREPQADKQS